MSWGYKIAILYGAFVVLIAGLIFRSSRENVDLVTPEYYDREIKYQAEIDGQTAVLNDGKQPEITTDSSSVMISIPVGDNGIANGEVEFYRPDNKELDKNYKLTGPALTIGRSQFAPGKYEIRMSWTEGTQNYNYESSLYLQ